MLSYTTFYFCRVSLSVVKSPLIDSGSLSAVQIGYISGLLMVVYGLGRLINSFLADHKNTKKILVWGLFLSAVINIILGIWLRAGVEGAAFFIMFMLLWGANGFFQSMGPGAGVVCLIRWFPKSCRGTFYSIFSTTPHIGRFLAYALFGYMASKGLWREVFICAGCLGLVISALSMRLLHESPEKEGLGTLQEITGEEEAPKDKLDAKTSQRLVLKTPIIWIIAATSAMIYLVQFAVNDWGILYLQKAKEYSLMGASSMVGLQSLFAAAGVFSSGILADKMFKERHGLLAVLSCGGALLCLAVFVSPWNLPLWGLAAALYAFSFLLNLCYTLISGVMSFDLVPKQAIGATSGLYGLVCYMATGLEDVISGHLMESSIASGSYTGVEVFWIASLAAATLLTLVIGWFGRKAR